MHAQRTVIFDGVNNHVKNLRTDLQIEFQDRDDVFAVVWGGPDTILYAIEAEFCHKPANTLAHIFLLFRNVEDYDAPFLVPPQPNLDRVHAQRKRSGLGKAGGGKTWKVPAVT